VRSALRENKKALLSEVARVLYTTIDDDEYPPARAWLEPSAARQFSDRVVRIDELMGVELAPACHECLVAWLRGNGIDGSYSTEEQRFLRLAARLCESLRPRLEPTLQRISNMVFSRAREPTGWGFPSRKCRPFIAYTGNRTVGSVVVEVHDHASSLVGTVKSTLAFCAIPAGFASTTPIALEKEELSETGVASLVAWISDVDRFLRQTVEDLR
jgi:hypothetical protein